jgi:hypothetical protein
MAEIVIVPGIGGVLDAGNGEVLVVPGLGAFVESAAAGGATEVELMASRQLCMNP